jgi:hypothetical protein
VLEGEAGKQGQEGQQGRMRIIKVGAMDFIMTETIQQQT